MLELQRLRRDHETAVLAFERVNRAYFARSITDRGDRYFAEFAERHLALLAEQEAGTCLPHVLVEDGAAVVGRFNLYDPVDGVAEVGYRVAERVAGRGVATSALQELCRVASADYGLRTLRAAVADTNPASQRVLAKAGFVRVGATRVAGRPGASYERLLSGR